MIKGKHKYWVLFVFFVGSFLMKAQQKKDPFYQTTIQLGPVLSIYGNNTKHTSGMKAGMAFTASVKGHFRLNKTATFITGITYLTHANTFSSYYFPDSTLRLYDGKHTYTYESRFHDIIIPMSLKIKLGVNKQKASCFYTEIGWGLRKRVSSYLNVNSQLYGFSAYEGSAGNEFTTRYISKKSSGALLLSLGFDKNFREKRAGYFISLNYTRSTNRFYYKGDSGFPGNLYLQEHFVSLTGGFRF